MGDKGRFDEWEARLWERLAGLLPTTEDAGSFRDSREIGEQEAGIWFLLERLTALELPVDETTAAEIEVLAEHWGERASVHHRIDACARDRDRAASVRLVPDSEAVPGDARAAGITAGPVARMTVVPWIECTHCPSVLSRAHAEDAPGLPGYLAARYLVSRPDRDVPDIYATTDLLHAFESVLTCG
ncbi:hypothetical protein ACFXK0_25735 [Nocardia sp. NPDC059177]|uniref:hypothetical protein n=1 Tax=Nocardia sp. NPDC059177 TaxID=3346759 RepID=UPI0036BFB981